MIPGSSLV